MPRPITITSRDVAREADVSQASVSHAFNRPEKLSHEVRQRILAVAQRLRYPGPHPAARSLRSGRAGAIGFVVNDELSYALEDPAVSQMLRGIGQVSDLAAVALTILPCPVGRARQSTASSAFRLIGEAHVDGFLFESIPDHHAAVDTAFRRGLPVVIMGTSRLANVISVSIDERAAAREAAAHVIGLGHRRVAILVDRLCSDGRRGFLTEARRQRATNVITALRLDGYEDAFTSAGIAFATLPVFEAGGYLKAQADAAAAELLSTCRDVTAVIAVSDVMAFAVMDRASAEGRRIPVDLSLVGFDDVPTAAERGLTTIRQPIAEKGRIAAQALIDAIASRNASSTKLSTSLVIRATTASAPHARKV